MLRPNDIPELGPPRLAHLRATEYVQYKYITKQQFDRYFKFSFVRNPWSRLVSIYKHWNMHHVCDFRTFVMSKLKNGMYRRHYWFIRPQNEFVCDDNGEFLVDYIGRFERLQEDFLHVCRETGIECSPLPHVNKGDPGRSTGVTPMQILNYMLWLIYRRRRIPAYAGYQEYYDAETREFVEQRYARDVEIFGYEFSDASA